MTNTVTEKSSNGSMSMNLMRAIGAPSFNPMPPDQHRFLLDDGGNDVNRFVAYIWQHTIQLGHPSKGFDQRSPFAVDENGKPVKVEHAAEYFGWDPGYARKIQRRAKEQGRVRTDPMRRIWLCGEVKPTVVTDEHDEDDQEPPLGKGEDKAKKKDCTRYIQPSILLEINKRPKRERAAILAIEAREADLFDRALADAASQLRFIRDQRQDNRFRSLQLPERKKKSQPADKPAKAPVVQLKLVVIEETANETGPVQSSEETAKERTVQVPKNGSVQSSPPYIYREGSRETTTTDRPPSDDVVVVGKIQDYGGTISQEAARKFLNNCRAKAPGCSIEEVTAAIDQIGGTLSKQTRNPTGVLVTGVPPLLATQNVRPKTVQREVLPCHLCLKPLDSSGTINGAHFECWEAASRERAKGAVS